MISIVVGLAAAAGAIVLVARRTPGPDAPRAAADAAVAPREAGAEAGVGPEVAANHDGGGRALRPIEVANLHAGRLQPCLDRARRSDRRDGPCFAVWGKRAAAFGVRIGIGADGKLVQAKSWGEGGKLRACIQEEIGRWPTSPASEPVTSVDYALGGMTWSCRASGDTRLFVAGYFGSADLDLTDIRGPWLLLRQGGEGAQLIPTVAQESVTGEGAWKVSCEGCGEGDLFLLKGSAVARHHPERDAGSGGIDIPTVWMNREKFLDEAGIDVALGARQYRLFAQPRHDDEQVVLQSGDAMQVLTTGRAGSHLVSWAGDVDGDGRLDLLVESGPDFPSYDLFVSAGERTRLVHHEAAFMPNDGD